MRRVVQEAGLAHGDAHDEHAQQEQHDVDVDGLHRVLQADLSGEQDGDGAAQHDLPDLQAEPAHLSDGDENEDDGQHEH